MKKKDLITLGILILFTFLSAITSNNNSGFKYIIIVILALSFGKFILVVFNFMELKKANIFWKISIVGFLMIFIITILLLV